LRVNLAVGSASSFAEETHGDTQEGVAKEDRVGAQPFSWKSGEKVGEEGGWRSPRIRHTRP
jgi:hypothetical protein